MTPFFSGYFPYPGTNHCGEYISWAEDFYAGLPLQLRYDPYSRCNPLAVLEAFVEESRTKLLQAILLDPQAPTYYQACAMIDEMCELQKELLPKLEWN